MSERDLAAEVAALLTSTIYPRFLGMDDGGDLVWELENGRWTFGDDPHAALHKQRTWNAERYVTKFGVPTRIKTLDEIRQENQENQA